MKKIKILLIAFLLILLGAFFSSTYAAETRNLGAQLIRPFTNSKYQYTVPSNIENQNVKYTVVKIFDNDDKNTDNELNYEKTFYCMRGGLGFGANIQTNGTDISETPVQYTEVGEMVENAETVIEKYEELYNVDLDRVETINIKSYNELYEIEQANDVKVNIYNAILWILDEAYLPTDGENYNEVEYKKELLTKAGVPEIQQNDITKDDIETIQQLAIWYFTNYDEQKAEINPTVSQPTINPTQFLSINGDNNLDKAREENLNRIYQYFIYNAIVNSEDYRNKRIIKINEYVNEFDHDVKLEIKNVEGEGQSRPGISNPYASYYEIGPFTIKNGIRKRQETVDISNLTLYDADDKIVDRIFELGPETRQGVYEIYNKTTGEKVTELEKGLEYYIRFYKVFEKGSDYSLLSEEQKFNMENVKLGLSYSYVISKATFFEAGSSNQAVVEIEKELKEGKDEITTESPKEFDLSLRKFITSINGDEPETSRVPKINTTTLINGIENRNGDKEYTATYTHPKNPLKVETGDKVIYTIRVYNEGEIDGIATEVTDYLPEGLEFIPATNSTINSEYGWTVSSDGRIVTTSILGNTIIKAFDKTKTEEETEWQKAETGEGGLYYADLKIECTVVATVSKQDKNLRNIAAITEDNGDDRDSVPGDPGRDDYNPTEDNSTYKEDDDDYEDLVLPTKKFDLALRKYITSVNGKETETSRVPQIDTSKMNTIDKVTGKEVTTATYVHPKNPLTVKKGDLVTYKIRVYNEGERDGYVTSVTDYLPEGLGFLFMASGDINSDWQLSSDNSLNASPLFGENGIYASEDKVLKKSAYTEVFGKDINLADIQVVKSDKDIDDKALKLTATTKKEDLIKHYGADKQENDLWQQSTNSEDEGLFYQELEITCLVLKENTYKGILKNVAEITGARDSEKNEIINIGDDRDSEPNNVYLDEKHTPGTEINGYTPGEQDDDDFEPLQLKFFDLALRKFITGVETNGKTEEVTSRIPVPTMNEEGKIKYNHTKDPVYVANNDIVTYTIRVFNEGTIAGYAEEVTDDIPEGLEYLPENNTNKEYEWKMYDKDGKETDKVEEAVKVKTDYLSSAKEIKETDNEKETPKRDNLLKPFDSSLEISTVEPYNPDYRDVKIAFKVTEPNTSDRILINSAQISEDSDDDEDSIPDEWNEGEDDQDKEYIYVRYFDLSLLKWVTKTVVTVDKTTTTTETGFKPNTGKTETTGIRENTEAEPIAKVEIDKKKLNKTTVKFVYKIRVTNEGEIEGYATEVTDFIPEGLEFKEEDNKAFGWKKEGENKVTTRALETVLLKPGESKELEIVFTWKNSADNLGLKTNIAEITEDYNEHNSKDIDSTPDNKKDPYEKEQEDDDDFALVILSLKTGNGPSYVLFTTAMIAVLAGGIYLVKRYVLTY